MRASIVTTVLAAVLAGLVAAPATGAPTISRKACSQIKNGPYAAYTSALGHHLKGRTWTVFANGGVPCSVATKLAPTVLTWWAANKGGGALILPGWSCSRDRDRAYSGNGYSSGGAGCVTSKYGANGNISIRMTGPYTLAQLRALIGG